MYRHQGGDRNKRLHHHTEDEALSPYMHRSLDFLIWPAELEHFTVPLEEGIIRNIGSPLVSYKIPFCAAAFSLKSEDGFCYLPSPFWRPTFPKPAGLSVLKHLSEELTGVCPAREKRTLLASPGISTSGDPGALWWGEKNQIQRWK